MEINNAAIYMLDGTKIADIEKVTANFEETTNKSGFESFSTSGTFNIKSSLVKKVLLGYTIKHKRHNKYNKRKQQKLSRRRNRCV